MSELAEHRRNVANRRNWEHGMYVGPALRLLPRKEDRNCACGIPDEYGRYPIGVCGPECEGRYR